MMRSEAPEMIKSKVFEQTCSQLSHFLKERRSLGEFGFHNLPSSKLPINGTKEICGSTNATMNLFPSKMEKEGNISEGENFKSLDLFPLMSSSVVTNTEESNKSIADQRELAAKEESKNTTATMTIFYGGKVLVFDDITEDKAQQIMTLATQGKLTQTQTPPKSNMVTTAQLIQGSVHQEHAGSSDLPIARRVSLHRFMEKRKDRIAANSPYPIQNPSASTRNQEKRDVVASIGQRQEQVELKLF